jgi:anti-sigma factor RsiW
MSDDRRIDRSVPHEEISSLIPWYVNGTIGDLDRQRLDQHLPACAACRDDVLLERRVHASMARDTPVEYMPAASLKRLQATLDASGAGAPRKGGPTVAPPARARLPS